MSRRLHPPPNTLLVYCEAGTLTKWLSEHVRRHSLGRDLKHICVTAAEEPQMKGYILVYLLQLHRQSWAIHWQSYLAFQLAMAYFSLFCYYLAIKSHPIMNFANCSVCNMHIYIVILHICVQ